MASCKLGHIYIVRTALTKPPKPKFALCASIDYGFFLWINSIAKPHGKDQMAIQSGCHELVVKDCFLDLSRVVQHPTYELEDAREFERITADFANDIIECIDAGLFLMPPNHSQAVREGMMQLL
ncbi:MAG: hypothetical protein E5Y34_30635 [Mesorhizobium sp.]|uniref:hypothetical protein n=1 Tax=Mesorhizobium sp. TaxID=1871066 RepID=UPI001210D6A7|nr:hypothetical protein [Mesorhizobium sp.]TIM94452.1 MAG: hypothetical protein E5Y34_30635 [Mesorhizobium sp.]